MQRLKTRAQFQATMSAGTIARTPHFALHRMVLTPQVTADGEQAAGATGPGSEDPQALFGVGVVRSQAWVGAMAPKRWARRSVTRHAIKRQIYAVVTDYEHGLQQAAHVVRLRAGFDRKEFVSASSDALKSAVRAELQQLFAAAVRRIESGAEAQPAVRKHAAERGRHPAAERPQSMNNASAAAQSASTAGATDNVAENAVVTGSEAQP